jgi:hypothetical protein
MVVTMKITHFCDVTPCSLVQRQQLLSETFCLYLQGRSVSQDWMKWVRIHGEGGTERVVAIGALRGPVPPLSFPMSVPRLFTFSVLFYTEDGTSSFLRN